VCSPFRHAVGLDRLPRGGKRRRGLDERINFE
jgi:hypothetical protein